MQCRVKVDITHFQFNFFRVVKGGVKTNCTLSDTSVFYGFNSRNDWAKYIFLNYNLSNFVKEFYCQGIFLDVANFFCLYFYITNLILILILE